MGDWAPRRAWFKLSLLHPSGDEARHSSKEATHSFAPVAVDWGFTSFLPLADVRAEFVHADGSVVVRCELSTDPSVVPPEALPPGGVLGGYLGNQHYDCRRETGHGERSFWCVWRKRESEQAREKQDSRKRKKKKKLNHLQRKKKTPVGLKNQGATCYMNSLLQTLHNLNAFRRAVYHMPTSPDDEPHASIALALQSLFFKLQFGPSAVPTKDLTRSFGWDSVDAFMQHDVQELNRVLCEKLEEQMKGTAVDGTVARLFEGHTENFVRCINVECESTRKESFMDLQLDVKGCKDVYASFDAYTAVETLDGQNQYNAEGHGLQDAKKGVLFDDFPPVLQLQLKRFEYDFARDTMVKINDLYEFPEELDLDVGGRKYLSKDSDARVRNLYKVRSFLLKFSGFPPPPQSGGGGSKKLTLPHLSFSLFFLLLKHQLSH